MSQPFVAEIRMFGGNFAPKGWALCNGQIIGISQNTALFSLIGTYYGGNGTSNFALPNLQGKAPLAQGNGNGLTPRSLGESGGETSVTLQQTQMAAHSHPIGCQNGGGSSPTPGGNVWADSGAQRGEQLYASTQGTPQTMANGIFGPTGSGQPHNNMPPFLTVNFIIALQGVYPSRN